MTKKEQLRKDISFEEKIQRGIFPSREEFSRVYCQELTRDQICQYFNFSISTFKKLRKFYNLPSKKRVIADRQSYKGRSQKAQRTLEARYGTPGSEQRKAFYAKNRAKIRATNLKRYGVANSAQVPHVIEQRKQTCLSRYGVDNPMKNQAIQEKVMQTDLARYGTAHHITAAAVIAKATQTKIRKYGSTNVFVDPAIVAKRRSTNLARYGVEHVLQSQEIRAKGYQTMSDNGVSAVLASKQQRHLAALYHGNLNHLIGYYHVDCYLEQENIAVEYNGSGHDLSVRLKRETIERFMQKEHARYAYFANHNIPVLVLVSKTDRLPSDNILLQCLQDSIRQFREGKKYIEINLDSLI